MNMTTREASFDHAAEARKFLAFALDNDTAEGARLDYMRAQTEASLALVEQQRIANLIALAGIGPKWEQDALHENVQTDPDAKFPIWQLRDDIKKGLGL